MLSVRSRLVRALIVEGYMKKILNFGTKTVTEIRQKETALPVPRGTSVTKTTIAELPAEWIRAANVPEGNKPVILYFHGGGFVSGSCDTHRGLVVSISKASRTRVLLIEYRLAPENKYPAANDDCLAAYRFLINNGISSKNIILGGDSAGGALVLMTLLSLRDAGDQLPAAAFLLSPLGDLINFDGESYKSRAKVDPFYNNNESSHTMSDYYIDNLTVKPPILSPIKQNLAGLPNLLIQVGDHEVLLNDSTRLAERAKAVGVDVTLEIWPKMWHVFQGFASMMPEAKQAVDKIGEFIRKNLVLN